MNKITATKRQPLHRKKKKTSTVNRTQLSPIGKSKSSQRYIDVTDKSRIVVVKGDRTAEQAALIALRSELAVLTEVTENFAFSIQTDTPKKHKPTRRFVMRLFSRE